MVALCRLPYNARLVAARETRRLKFIAPLPFDERRFIRGLYTEVESESRHFPKAFKTPIVVKLVRNLVIIVVDVIFRLRLAPRRVVPFELHPFADRKRRNSH